MNDELDEAMVRADAMIQAGDPRGEIVAMRVALERQGIVTDDDYVFSPLPNDEAERARELLWAAQAAERAFDQERSRKYFWHRGIPDGIQITDVTDFECLRDPAIPVLRRLDLSKQYPASVSYIGSLDLSELTTLRIGEVPWPAAFEHLVSRAPKLRALSIGSLLDRRGFPSLLEWPGLAQLRVLAVTAPFQIDSFRLLEDGRTPALETFLFSGDHFGFANNGARLPNRLVLQGRYGFDSIVEHPSLATVRDLEVDGILDSSLRVLARSHSIERLSLRKSPATVSTLVELVRHLPLAKFYWSPEGVPEGVPAHASLVRALAGEPSCARLRDLGLYSAKLGDDGAETLAASPHLANLRRLWLTGNEITERGQQAWRHCKYARF